MALEDGGYELQIRRPLDAVGWGAVAGAAVLCLVAIALTPIVSWSSLVCFVIVPLCTLFVWARRVRTGRVEDGVLVLRDFGGEVRHLEVGRFVPRLEDGVVVPRQAGWCGCGALDMYPWSNPGNAGGS